MRKTQIFWGIGVAIVLFIAAIMAVRSQSNTSQAATGTVMQAASLPTSAPRVTPSTERAVPRTDVVVGPNGRAVTVTDSLRDDSLIPAEITRIMGSPAIVPSKQNVGVDSVAFSDIDVRGYHEARQSLGGQGAGHFLSSVPTQIEKIEFGTVQDFMKRDPLLAQMLDDLGLANNDVLCVVQYSGSFTENRPRGMDAPIRPYVLEVFDAHTGNRLMSSTLNTLK